jgi:tetratricopeptide (TPR) repeat protein
MIAAPTAGRESKKKVFWLITLSVPIFFIIALELMLCWVDYGDRLEFVDIHELQGRKYYTVNKYLAQRYFYDRRFMPPKVYDDSFEAEKSSATYRIFCIGESTIQGFPYEYNGALPRLISDRLKNLFPNRKIEVINLGITAINSFAILDIVKEAVHYKPDLLIIYSGHNEFYGSPAIGFIGSQGNSRLMIDLFLTCNKFKVFQLMKNSIVSLSSIFRKPEQGIASTTFMELLAQEKRISYRSEWYERTREQFRENLSNIIDVAASNNIPIMLSTAVSNLRDQPPFFSEFSLATSKEQQERWSKIVQEGKRYQTTKQFEASLEKFLTAWQIDSTRADLSYDVALCYEQMGRIPEAKRYFKCAKDLDCVRFRASDEFNEIIREICQQRHIMLADLEKPFEDQSPNGIIGNNLMLEHLHPNLDGDFLLAKEYVHTMNQHNLIIPADQWPQFLPDSIYKGLSMMTTFDFEVSFLRLDNLLHHWPFSEPESTRYKPTTEEGNLAVQYLQQKITWEQAHYQLADLYKKQRRYIDAEREYLALAKTLWYDYNPLILAGDVDLSVKDFAIAEQHYRAALTRADNQFTQVRLGALFLETGKPDSAIQYFRRALETDAKSQSKFLKEWRAQIILHLGQAYILKEDFIHARDELNEVLALDPRNKEAEELLRKINAR